MMTYEEAIEYIHAFTWSQWKLGLDRTRELLRLLGDPQKELKFIHVAGSNGKGSTCAMVERILREAGYSTGMYPSPYIEDFRERIQYNGEMIPKEALCSLTETVKKQAEKMEDHPSQFEIITAIGMLFFREMRCDIVVLEVGLGGTHDSTNVIDAPEVAVITNIGLEHTEYLGNTLAEIAANKGGIIKEGSFVVCYENAPEVMEVIRRICAEKEAPIFVASFDRIKPLSGSFSGQTFRYADNEEVYSLNLLGEYQLHNAATAFSVVEAMRKRGWEIPEKAVREGLRKVSWPARFEVLCLDPLLILDGGHNPQCAQALAESLKVYFPGEKVTFLLGLLKDKDRERIYESIAPFGAEYICLTPNSDRALSAAELALFLSDKGETAQAVSSVEEGILQALHTGRPVVAFGSLYMAGEVKKAYRRACKVWQRRKASGKRRLLSREEKEIKSRAICEALLALPETEEASTCFSYMAMTDEVDLSYFHEEMERRGKRVAFPITFGNGEMCAAVPAKEDGWTVGAYGIRTPVREKAEILSEEEIDLVIVPCVAFDEGGDRIGHGAGYYDRYLSRCDLKKTKTILVAFEAQRIAKICTEDTDIRIPLVVTEDGASGISETEGLGGKW